MLFHLKIKIKAIFSTRRQLLLCVARRHGCFVLKQSVTVTSLKLNCFKLIGWFNHHNVFPPIRSVCYRFLHCDYRKFHCDYKKLHCDYRKLHCDYRKLHCCLGFPSTHVFFCLLYKQNSVKSNKTSVAMRFTTNDIFTRKNIVFFTCV
jgi:hypothetical protein